MTYKLGPLSLSGSERNELFRNDGVKGFRRIGFVSGAESKLDSRGFVAADFDRDGDLDLFLVNNDQPAQYIENRAASGHHWVVVALRGKGRNSHAIGARVRVTAGGRTQVREIHAGSGYLSSPPPEAHFGLGRANKIERIEIRWPGGGRQVLRDQPIDRVIRIEQGGES